MTFWKKKKTRDKMDSENLSKHLLECSASRDAALYSEPKLLWCCGFVHAIGEINARCHRYPSVFLPHTFISAWRRLTGAWLCAIRSRPSKSTSFISLIKYRELILSEMSLKGDFTLVRDVLTVFIAKVDVKWLAHESSPSQLKGILTLDMTYLSVNRRLMT